MIHVATRQQRMDAFVHEGEPPADSLLELLCEDHVGTYVLPFACRSESGDWTNAETGARIEASVVGWRVHETEARHRSGMKKRSDDTQACAEKSPTRRSNPDAKAPGGRSSTRCTSSHVLTLQHAEKESVRFARPDLPRIG